MHVFYDNMALQGQHCCACVVWPCSGSMAVLVLCIVMALQSAWTYVTVTEVTVAKSVAAALSAQSGQWTAAYLEGLASVVAEGSNALRVQVLGDFISLGLEGAVDDD